MRARIHPGSTVELDARKLATFLMLVTLASVLVHSAFAASEDDAIVRTFGIKRGGPINGGFFFRICTYVEAPYIVERRGTDIYINDHLVDPGRAWPRYDYRVSEDPGDPPSDSSPFDFPPDDMDSRDIYWSRKWHYLVSHHPREDAKQMMLETWRKCPKVEKAYLSEDDDDRAVLLSADGTRKSVDLWYIPRLFEPPLTKQEMLQRREKAREFYERALQGNVFLFAMGPDGPEVCFPTRRGVKVVNTLLSAQTVEEKTVALGAPDVCVPTYLRETLVTEFRSSPQLKERVRKLDEELKTQQLHTDIMADARTATDAIADIGIAELSGQTPSVRNGNSTSDAGDQDPNDSPLDQEASPQVLGVEGGNSGPGRTLMVVASVLFVTCVASVMVYIARRRRAAP